MPSPAPSDLIEHLAARVHDAFVATAAAQGVTSRRSPTGEEQMVPYGDLSEAAKDFDRATVRTVLTALADLAETPRA